MSRKISIVIPCRNEEDFILRCLDSVFNSDYPAELIEVLVCDGKSDDKTPSMVQEYAKQKSNVRYLVNEKITTPFALNLGITNSEGEVIIILGAHTELAANYISECVAVLNQMSDVWCVGGVLHNVSSDELTASVSLAMSSPFGVGNAHFRTGAKDGYVDTVAFGAYRKEVFDKIGLFDEELARNQDDEFNFRLLKNGGKIWLTTATTATYYVRSSFQKLFKQYFQYGYWKVYVNKKHKSITTLRQLVPAVFVLTLYALIIMVILFPYRWEYLILFLGIYSAGASLFALKLAENFKQFFSVLFSFIILHISYGMGYVEGFVNFIFLNRKPSKSKSDLTR
ncbi:MAG: glycosyltransferase family 2 protein [Bacteroidia bacterium]